MKAILHQIVFVVATAAAGCLPGADALSAGINRRKRPWRLWQQGGVGDRGNRLSATKILRDDVSNRLSPRLHIPAAPLADYKRARLERMITSDTSAPGLRR
jgi:hypothetical protein